MLSKAKTFFINIKSKYSTSIFKLCIVLFFILSFLHLHNSWISIVNGTSRQALNLAMTAEAGFQVKSILMLDAAPTDTEKEEYKQIKKSLIRIAAINPNIRFAYIYKKINEKFYFLADSELVGSKDYSPPGQEYAEATEVDFLPYEQKEPVITPATTDRWGTWISVLIPIIDEKTGSVVAVFGVDYPAHMWNKVAVSRTWRSSITILSLFILLLFFYIASKKSTALRIEKNKLIKANKEIAYAKNSLKRAQSIAHVGDWEYDLKTKQYHASDEAFNIYGLPHTTSPITHKNVQDAILEEDRARRIAALEALVEHDTDYDIEFRIIRSDNGEERILHSNAILEKDNAGDPIKIIGIIHDVTDQKKAEAKLKESEARFRTIFEQSPIGIGITDAITGQIYKMNHRFTQILGRTKKEIEELNWLQATFPDDLQESIEKEALLKQGAISHYKINKRYIKPDGHLVWVSLTVAAIKSTSFDESNYICMIEDVSERILAEDALRESERSKAMLLSNLYGMAYRCKYDRDYTIQFVSEGCYDLTGYKPEDLVASKTIAFNEIILPQYREPIWNKWSTTLQNKTKFRNEYQIRAASGEIKWVWEQGQGVYDANNNVIAIEGFILDITDRKKYEEEIIHMNYHDVLTGLYNRTFFNESIVRCDMEEHWPLSIIMGDVNGLKLINDTFGHAAGDKVLIEIARILLRCSKPKDIVCRISGDEFCILLPQTTSEQTQQICNQIYDSCKAYENEIDKEFFYLSISLGHATKTNAEQSIDNHLRSAEEFMYKRKLMESKSMHSTILSWIKTTMFEKSHETEEHAERLVDLSSKLGKAIHLSEEQMFELLLVSTLHDIGKMSIDDSILNKPSCLTETEWCEIRKHPSVGYRIARASPELMHIADYILCHHEQWDGKGYPQGLEGESIPLFSRIVSIVDSFDAMTEDRPYRKAMSKKAALEEIERKSGTQFDPALTKIFIEIMRSVNE